jgi:hypothetical protein
MEEPEWEDQEVVCQEMCKLQVLAYHWATKLGVPFKLVFEEEDTVWGNGETAPGIQFWNVREVPAVGEITLGRHDRRRQLVDYYWGFREWLWPWCTVNAADPFSPMAPMPKGWLRRLLLVCHPRILLELQNCDPHYHRHTAVQRAHVVWKYLFDYYPWVLPQEIGRHPYWEELTPEQQNQSLPLGEPFY